MTVTNMANIITIIIKTPNYLCVCLGFALGWGPIPWLIMSEVFPVKARGFASAVCVLTNWSMAFLVTKTFQDMMVGLNSWG